LESYSRIRPLVDATAKTSPCIRHHAIVIIQAVQDASPSLYPRDNMSLCRSRQAHGKAKDCISMLLHKSNHDFYQIFSVLSLIQFDRTCSAFSASCLVDLSAKLNESDGHLLIKGNGSPRSCLQHTLAIIASQVPHPDAKILHVLTPHSLADTCANSCAIGTIWALHQTPFCAAASWWLAPCSWHIKSVGADTTPQS